LIKSFPPAFPVSILSDEKPSALEIQLQYFVTGFYLDVVFLLEDFGCSGDQLVLFIDDPADVIGNTSGCIRGVGTGFKYRNI